MAVTIEQRLQEPARFYFLAADEAVVLAFPILLGFMSRYIISGAVAALILWQVWRRVKGEGGIPRLLALIYWYLPTELCGFRGVPRSSVTVWRG